MGPVVIHNSLKSSSGYRPQSARPEEPTSGSQGDRFEKSILIQADIDHTLIAWADRKDQVPEAHGLEQSISELKKHQDMAVVGLSTARALAETTRLASMLAGVPLDFVAINSGQQLFFNKEGKPAEEFLSELNFKDADSEWNSTLQEQHSWNGLKASILLRQHLKEKGFQRVENLNPKQTEQLYRSDDLEIRLQPDQTYFKFRPTQAQGEKRITPFLDELRERFSNNGLECEVGPRYRCEEDLVGSLVPQGPSKSILLEHVVNRYPATKFVVSAGDRVDDVLKPAEVAGRPNFRIVAGKRKETRQVRSQAGVVATRKGFIAPGIRAQMNSISQLESVTKISP